LNNVIRRARIDHKAAWRVRIKRVISTEILAA